MSYVSKSVISWRPIATWNLYCLDSVQDVFPIMDFIAGFTSLFKTYLTNLSIVFG